MRGGDERSGSLFSYVDLEARVRRDHPLRMIREIVNAALGDLSGDFRQLHTNLGRPSIAPEKLLRAMLLQAFYGVRSERQLMERLEFDLLFRWFVGLGVDDPVWDHSTFSKNRDRLLEGEIAAKFLNAILAQPKVKHLLSGDHFSVDGTLIEAWASIKSFRRKDGGDNASRSGGRNAERSFHKEKRSNETHESTTDPEARLYKKGDGQPAKLCYMGHVLMENRNGLAVTGGVSQATGTAEREAALALIERRRRGSTRRITLGADKAYDVDRLRAGLKKPLRHPAHRHQRPCQQDWQAAQDRRRRTNLAPSGYAVSQCCRKRIEEVFGWIKSFRRPRQGEASGHAPGSTPPSPWRWQPTISSACPSFSEPPHEGQVAHREDAGLYGRFPQHGRARLHPIRR